MLHSRLRKSVLLRMRVINNQQIRSATGYRASYARSKVLPTMVRGPSTRSLAVRLQVYRIKYISVPRCCNEISNFTAKVYS